MITKIRSLYSAKINVLSVLIAFKLKSKKYYVSSKEISKRIGLILALRQTLQDKLERVIK